MSSRFNRRMSTLLGILLVVSVAGAEETYQLDAIYFNYSGVIDDVFGVPREAQPLCSAASFDDVELSISIDTDNLSHIADELTINVTADAGISCGEIRMIITGDYEVYGAGAAVDLVAFMDVMDNEMGGIVSAEFETTSVGFPIVGIDEAFESGSFSVSAVHDISNHLGFFGEDFDTIASIILIADGGANGSAEIRISDVKLAPRASFLHPWPGGDVNSDDSIDLADLHELVDQLVGNTPSQGYSAADINYDGKVDGRDIQRLVFSLITFGNCDA